MAVIDMRSRPSFLHPFFGAEPGTPAFETVRWVNRRVGSRDMDHFARVTDVPSFMTEMDDAGIDVAVAEHALTGLGLAGINLDVGFYAKRLRVDDNALLPIYALCEAHGVPAFILSGPTTPDWRFNDPLAVDHVARQFPRLTIVCCHGFYPNIDGMLAVAFRRKNVIVSSDMYVFAGRRALCGGGEPVHGGPVRVRIVLSVSAHASGGGDFRALGLSEASLEKAFFGNARRVLGKAVG